MDRSERTSPGDPGAYRSVPTQNLVRILSGELPMPGTAARHAQARAKRVQRPWSFWRELLHFIGLA